LELISKNRAETRYSTENVKNLNNVDDIRNGLIVGVGIHAAHDSRVVVVLKVYSTISSRVLAFLISFAQTPNTILNSEDVVEHMGSRLLHSGKREYPRGGRERYTLQWIAPDPNEDVQEGNEQQTPNNVDAAFLKDTGLPMPSGMLLHYNYGAAVVKHWGRNKSLVKDSRIPRPPINANTVSLGPPTTQNDRTVVLKKLEDARSEGGGSGGGTSQGGGCRDNEEWNEDDIVMFCWVNNNADASRWARDNEQSIKDTVMEWRAGVPVV
jgi:hypothetical protein